MRRRVLTAILCVAAVLAVLLAWIAVSRMPYWTAAPAQTGVQTFSTAPELPLVSLPADTQTQSLPLGVLPTSSEIQALWSPVVEQGLQSGWIPWLIVADAETGAVIYQDGAQAGHTPASTMKTLTGLVALTYLDPMDTLTTEVAQFGNDLYLSGEGDLLLGPGANNPDSVDGRAGIATLAAQVAKNIQGQGPFTLHYQDRLFDGPKRWAGWAEDGEVQYAGDLGPYAMYSGRVSPGAWQFVDDSALTVADSLVAALAERGIAVASTEPMSTPSPAAATSIGAVQSAPIFDQLRYMLTQSDNTMADQFCHMAARAAGAESVDFSSATENVKNTLVDLGVSVEGLDMRDCSGLDPASRLRPATLVDVLETSTQSTGAQASLSRMLPVAGISGTLTNRLEQDATFANVTGKTGTLATAAALVGKGQTASGRNLIFAVGVDDVANHYAWGTYDVIDRFVTGLFSL